MTTLTVTYITNDDKEKTVTVEYLKGVTYGQDEVNLFNAILETCKDLKKIRRIGG